MNYFHIILKLHAEYNEKFVASGGIRTGIFGFLHYCFTIDDDRLYLNTLIFSTLADFQKRCTTIYVVPNYITRDDCIS